VHPLFSYGYLCSLRDLPPQHPLKPPPGSAVTLEVAIHGQTGELTSVVVAETSGHDAFDRAAIAAISLASPFPGAPTPIFSSDNNVYFHWKIQADPVFACSTYFIHPYILVSENTSKSSPG
jgi:TonB family protein